MSSPERGISRKELLKNIGLMVGGNVAAAAGAYDVDRVGRLWTEQTEKACQCTEQTDPQAFRETQERYEDTYLIAMIPGFIVSVVGGGAMIMGLTELISSIRSKRRIINSENHQR